ncbi:MAG: DUF523 domain-containing protein [candidate division WOR-3 bacterium]|nr:DUF523 domain-containing protein [candidate division WOR-3 bacterium]
MSKTSRKTPIFLVSACLVGMKTRYDGGDSLREEIISLFDKGIVIPLCPEILGGLGIPRPKATIRDGRIINKEKKDVTYNFKKGAEEVLTFVKRINPDRIYLKEYSPSCGVKKTNINWEREKGKGITTKLLIENGYHNVSGIE